MNKTNVIDARGMACPTPVIMAKKEADKGQLKFTIDVDNKTAVENLTRFGNSKGFEIVVTEIDNDHLSVEFSKKGEESKADYGPKEDKESEKQEAPLKKTRSWAVFIGREGIGEGDRELGTTLMKMYFYTLEQGDSSYIPSYVLFMNDGVKVPVSNQQAIEHLESLEKMGTKILVCGACLNFYNLAADLKAGTVSNMYDIVEAMGAVDKVVTL
jgi:selenium metabolism protein YedF